MRDVFGAPEKLTITDAKYSELVNTMTFLFKTYTNMSSTVFFKRENHGRKRV